MTTGADRLCRVLEDRGVTCVFGVPGSQTVVLHDALRRSRIRVVLSTHELGASFMANGYYRASGRIAPLVTIPGPGFTYALTGLAEALHDSAALLHIVGCSQGTDPRRHFQALDQRSVALPLVKRALRIEAVGNVATATAEALDLALSGEPGPVLLEWTRSALASEAGHEAPASPPPRSEVINADVVQQTAALLASARRPVVVAGQGCATASDQLLEFAEFLGAPVVTTAAGRGVLAEDHPLALGFDFARSTTEALHEFLDEADCVVVVGCKLGASFRLDLRSNRVVRVDTSRESLDDCRAAVSILATARAFFEAVHPAVRRLHDSQRSGWSREEIERWRQRFRKPNKEPEPVVRGARSVTAAAFFSALRAALPRDAIVVADSGLHQILLRRHFDVLAPRGLIFPSDFQSMGFGIPAAVGAKLAAPGRAVVALVGDGGFAMSGLELLTAVREQIPLTVVVFADGALNYIRLNQLRTFGRTADVHLLNPDFSLLAGAVGARYVRYSGHADSVLHEAIACEGVTLIEVMVRDSAAFHTARLGGLARASARQVIGARTRSSLQGGFRWLFSRRTGD